MKKRYLIISLIMFVFILLIHSKVKAEVIYKNCGGGIIGTEFEYMENTATGDKELRVYLLYRGESWHYYKMSDDKTYFYAGSELLENNDPYGLKAHEQDKLTLDYIKSWPNGKAKTPTATADDKKEYYMKDQYNNLYTYSRFKGVTCKVKSTGEVRTYKRCELTQPGSGMAWNVFRCDDGSNGVNTQIKGDTAEFTWDTEIPEDHEMKIYPTLYYMDPSFYHIYTFNADGNMQVTVEKYLIDKVGDTVSYIRTDYPDASGEIDYEDDSIFEHPDYKGKTTAERYMQDGTRIRIPFWEVLTWSSEKPKRPDPIGDDDKRDTDGAFTIEKVMEDADGFLSKATGEQEISEKTVKNLSGQIYRTLMIIGVVVAFVIGGILAIEFITGGIEEKAQIKQKIIIYVIGLVLLFGAFTIWSVVTNALQDVAEETAQVKNINDILNDNTKLG